MNRFTGEPTEGYIKATKEEIKKALTTNKPGKCQSFSNEYYGDIIIVSTVIAGNLVLQHGFYPIAYIRPETRVAILNENVGDNENSQYSRLKNLIEETCTYNKIERVENVVDLIKYVDENQNYGLE